MIIKIIPMQQTCVSLTTAVYQLINYIQQRFTYECQSFKAALQ